MRMTTSSTFVLTKSAFNGLCKEYLKKNTDGIKNARDFLDHSKLEIYAILNESIENSPVKYNIKLEATYIIPNTHTRENRAFKTRSRSVFQSDDVNNFLELDFIKLLQEQEEMELYRRNRRNYIQRKCIQTFRSILAKLVNPVHAERIGSNYVEVENRYDFENINFPASLNDVAKFEKTNKVSVNIYSLKNGELKYKNNVKKIQKE
ncbi:unnamed protein product [Macrosiphum euphorbiae]|uniref:Uncharacterized protein n=1 Tax=Macrosiphum euphorbiae TaxID=13131 RepID=A0AAV0W941_9HEMI|nr:unnamed protein product [Macrosiphum euphorbiae]